MGADDLLSNGKDVAVLENHKTDNFSNIYSNARNNYYNVLGTPTAYFDGVLSHLGGSPTQSMYSNYLPKYNQRIGILSNFTIDILGTTDDFLSCELEINVNKVAGSYGSLKLFVVITESDIPYSWQGLSELNHVNRLMAPNQNGTDLNFTSQNNYQLNIPFNLSGSWVFGNCEVVVFLQNYATKEIYQAVKLSMNDFNPELVADFAASNVNPDVGEPVNFTDLSQNSPYTWDWNFTPGSVTYLAGTNNNSQHPQVQFNAPGLYSVSLTVSGPGGTDSETKSGYINAINHILSLDITAFCEGPFNGTSMLTTLNGSVPLYQPYNQSPWNYFGGEYVVTMPADIVDWVIVELRNASVPELATADNIIARQSALLKSNGKIVALDGSSTVDFDVTYNAGLFVVIHHRNHLSVMSASALTEIGGFYSWNFSTDENKAFGGSSAQNEIGSGIWGMIGGDSNADGIINSNDIDLVWTIMAGWHGYFESDSNFDGEVNNLDKNDFSLTNALKTTQVP